MFKLFKRIFDILFSLFFLILFLPIILFAIIIISILDFHLPFFIQSRSGLNGEKIDIIKLKTMKNVNGIKKITKIGYFLRLSKIDELPQLINVLINDMSIIGPRPLYIEFNKYYKKKHDFRIKVKPGITGLAQIKIKDSTNWNRKFNFDYIYTKKMSYDLEIFILIETVKKILKSIFIKKERAFEITDYKKNFYENYVNG